MTKMLVPLTFLVKLMTYRGRSDELKGEADELKGRSS